MDQPLGAAVGNALEIREVGRSSARARRTSRSSCSTLARASWRSRISADASEGLVRAEQAMADGSAREMYERWIRAQGGDLDLDALPRAPVITEVRAPRSGVVTRLAALKVGIASLELGGGRRTKEDEVDHAVGVVCSAKRGQTVEAGQVLADVHARDQESAACAGQAVEDAYEIGDERRRCAASCSRSSRSSGARATGGRSARSSHRDWRGRRRGWRSSTPG